LTDDERVKALQYFFFGKQCPTQML